MAVLHCGLLRQLLSEKLLSPPSLTIEGSLDKMSKSITSKKSQWTRDVKYR